MTLPRWIAEPPAMEPWAPRASSDAARLDAMAAALRARYPGASVRVAVSSPVVEVSVSRDGRGWLSTRIHGAITSSPCAASAAISGANVGG